MFRRTEKINNSLAKCMKLGLETWSRECSSWSWYGFCYILAMMDWWPSWLFSPFLIYLLGKTWKTKDKYSKYPFTYLLSYRVVSSIPGSVLCSRHRVNSTEFCSSVSIFRHLPKIKTEKGMELHMLGAGGEGSRLEEERTAMN